MPASETVGDCADNLSMVNGGQAAAWTDALGSLIAFMGHAGFIGREVSATEAEPNPSPFDPRAALLLGWSCAAALTVSDAYPSLLAAVTLSLAVTTVWVLLTGLSWERPGTSRIEPGARGNLTVLLGGVLLLRAASSALVVSTRGIRRG